MMSEGIAQTMSSTWPEKAQADRPLERNHHGKIAAANIVGTAMTSIMANPCSSMPYSRMGVRTYPHSCGSPLVAEFAHRSRDSLCIGKHVGFERLAVGN